MDCRCAGMDARFPPILWARPTWQLFTLAAKRREHRDSSTRSNSGQRLTNINVLQAPPKQLDRTWVSLELRKGTCAWPWAMELMTLLRFDRLLLMKSASLSCWPLDLLFLSRSLPARSIKFSIPERFSPLLLFSIAICIWKIEWLREEWMLHCVEPTVRAR